MAGSGAKYALAVLCRRAFNLSFRVIDDPNKTAAIGPMFALLSTGSLFFETRSGAEPKDVVIVPNEAYAHLDRMVRVGCWKVGSWHYEN
jgi:hypothetical protein